MRVSRAYSIIPKLPKALEPLWDLAYNFWFAWNPEIERLFTRISPELWLKSNQNPIQLLNQAPQTMLENLAEDEIFMQYLVEAKAGLDSYMSKPAITFPDLPSEQPAIAYFSLEYGLAQCMPIYSGGLGILAGDHLKSASDLNLPMVAVGLCYRQGYFHQYLTTDGWQQEHYPNYNFDFMPMRLVRGQDKKPVTITVDLAGQPLLAQIWQVQVGRISLYLLDSSLAENPPEMQKVTERLYDGGSEMRLRQEILIGIGGTKALRQLGLTPRVIHMNEGHCAFAALQRIHDLIANQHISFEAATELTAAGSVFTTHTPVPAGNDRFSSDLMSKYFEKYSQEMGLAFPVFLALGRTKPADNSELFCMTVLALRLTRFSNGVSNLHGEVSRKMWTDIWPDYPDADVPIGAITNGVHVPSWLSADLADIYDRYLGPNWREDRECFGRCSLSWSKVKNISEAELWKTHEQLRVRLVDFVRYRLRRQIKARGGGHEELESVELVLSPDALTIGFARRFATYKRAYLLMKDKARLLRLLGDKDRPIQFIFAGKAHPEDNDGKRIIQELYQLCQTPECRYSMVFLEDYDIDIAKHMVQGCDVWLNTPRRPLEASGTSGMKATANAVLNLSTLDGWWAEAYSPETMVGWSIGRGETYGNQEYQDFVESQTLYNLLETEVIPTFYDRDRSGMPRDWIAMMRNALYELSSVFNSNRMVDQYMHEAYLPAAAAYARLSQDDFAPAKRLATWRMALMTKWSGLVLENLTTTVNDEQMTIGDNVTVEIEIFMNGLTTSDIQVEIYAGSMDSLGDFTHRYKSPMYPVDSSREGWRTYRGAITPAETGRFGLTVRVLPFHPDLIDPRAMGLVHWA